MNLESMTDQQLLEYKQRCVSNISKWNNAQLAKKILLNSLFGAMGAPFFRYYDRSIAESITVSGQQAIKWVGYRLNQYLNNIFKTDDIEYVFYSDTDSCYITLEHLVNKYFDKESDKNKIVGAVDEFCKKRLEPKIESIYNDLYEYMNAYENHLVMGREAIADRGFWTGKKRYCIRVWDNEGVRYEKPKLKYMGLSAKSSSTNTWARPKLVDLYSLMIDGTKDDITDFIGDIEKRWNDLPIETIAVPTGVNNLAKYSDSRGLPTGRCPKHVRAALNHNFLLKKLEIQSVSPIGEGSKMRWLQLKMPNPYKISVIGFENILPKDFGLEQYVDRKAMFVRGFVDPARTVLDPLGLDHEKVCTLESFFGG